MQTSSWGSVADRQLSAENATPGAWTSRRGRRAEAEWACRSTVVMATPWGYKRMSPTAFARRRIALTAATAVNPATSLGSRQHSSRARQDRFALLMQYPSA